MDDVDMGRYVFSCIKDSGGFARGEQRGTRPWVQTCKPQRPRMVLSTIYFSGYEVIKRSSGDIQSAY